MKKYAYIGALLLAMTVLFSLSLKGTHGKTGNVNEQGASLNGGIEQGMSTPSVPQQPLAVSVVRLIADPTAYQGKYVRVIGFVSIEFERTAVYLHQEDYKVSISKNALWLAIDRSDLQRYTEGNQKYVLIEGTFDANYAGHRGAFSGTIKGIRRFQVWAETSAQQ